MRNLFNIAEIAIFGYGIHAMFTGDIEVMFIALGIGLTACFIKNLTTRKVSII